MNTLYHHHLNLETSLNNILETCRQGGDIGEVQRWAKSAKESFDWIDNFAVIKECEAPKPTPAPELYTVVTISSNANSFGLKGVLCLAPSGKGVEAGIQAYGSDPLPQIGDTLTLEQLRSRSGIALRELKTITPEQAAEVLAEVNAKR
jgi:hypothetical protein